MTIKNNVTKNFRMRSKRHAQACFYAALVCVGEATYFYPVRQARSLRGACHLALATHHALGLLTPDICEVTGLCRRRNCRCGGKVYVWVNLQTPRGPKTHEYLLQQTPKNVAARIEHMLRELDGVRFLMQLIESAIGWKTGSKM